MPTVNHTRHNKAELYAMPVKAAEKRIVERLPSLIDNMLTLAEGVKVEGAGNVYSRPPDRDAKPRQLHASTTLLWKLLRASSSRPIAQRPKRGITQPMRVYLVRHGQTAWNAERRAQGHTDIPLDAEGERQTRFLAESYGPDAGIRRILSSDLKRSLDTAQALAGRLNIDVEVRHDLRERTFGDWEGEPFEKIAQNFIDTSLLTGDSVEEIRPPNGESQLDVWNRLEIVSNEIAASAEPMMVIAHGGCAALLLSRLLRGTLYTARSFRFDNTGVTTIGRRPEGGFHLLRYNDTSHLRQTSLTGSVDGSGGDGTIH